MPIPAPYPDLPAGSFRAGFWRRGLALLLDGLLFMVLMSLLALVVDLPGAAVTQEMTRTKVTLKTSLSYTAWPFQLLMAGWTLLFWSVWQATPCKRLLGLRIVDARTGGPAGAAQYVLRYLCYFLSALPLGLGFFWALWGKEKRAWHDRIARTAVVLLPRGAN